MLGEAISHFRLFDNAKITLRRCAFSCIKPDPWIPYSMFLLWSISKIPTVRGFLSTMVTRTEIVWWKLYLDY